MSDSGLTGKRIVLTGADGFVGRYVLDALRTGRAEAVPLVGPGGDATVGHQIDLRSGEDLLDAVRGADAVIHLAARAGGVQFQEDAPHEVFWDNTQMTRRVLEASADGNIPRCFLASSAVIYSSRAASPLTEGSPLVQPGMEPVSSYAWSKITDEVLGRWMTDLGQVDVVMGRFTNVFGRGARFDASTSTVVHALVKKVADAGSDGVAEVWGDGTAVRSFIHARDCASAILRILIDGTPGEAYNVSSTAPVSIRELAEKVRSVVDPSVRLAFDPSRPTGAHRRVLDASKLASLGFQAEVELEQGIADVAEAYGS